MWLWVYIHIPCGNGTRVELWNVHWNGIELRGQGLWWQRLEAGEQEEGKKQIMVASDMAR